MDARKLSITFAPSYIEDPPPIFEQLQSCHSVELGGGRAAGMAFARLANTSRAVGLVQDQILAVTSFIDDVAGRIRRQPRPVAGFVVPCKSDDLLHGRNATTRRGLTS
jgi:hypothetical protein